MRASVGSLLDDAHARALDLCSDQAGSGTGGSTEDAAALLAAWPRLAASALRVLDAVRIEPVWLDDTLSVRDLLGEVVEGQGGRPAPDSVAAPSSVEGPSRPALAIATRLGAIADLLAGQPDARTEDDRAAAVGLQANVLAVVHAVAAATLAALEDRNGLQSDRWLMRGVLARTERFAVTPASRRTGRYEDVAANTTGDRSLDSAIGGWVRSTVAVLQSRHLATQTALQVAAGDALMLTGSAATVCLAATHLGIVEADRGGRALDALSAAHESGERPRAGPRRCGWAASAIRTRPRHHDSCGGRSPRPCARRACGSRSRNSPDDTTLQCCWPRCAAVCMASATWPSRTTRQSTPKSGGPAGCGSPPPPSPRPRTAGSTRSRPRAAGAGW